MTIRNGCKDSKKEFYDHQKGWSEGLDERLVWMISTGPNQQGSILVWEHNDEYWSTDDDSSTEVWGRNLTKYCPFVAQREGERRQ